VRLALNEPVAIRRVAVADDNIEPDVLRLKNVVTVVLTSEDSPRPRLLFPAAIEEGMMIDAIQHNSGLYQRRLYDPVPVFENKLPESFRLHLPPEPQKK
jgi:hypothetical protein